MYVKQLSIFLENRVSRLGELAKALEKIEINIRAISLCETADFGILRLIVNDPEKAFQELKKCNFIASLTDVIAVEIPDKPGGLAGVMKVLEDSDIRVEYMYAFVEKSQDKAVLVFRFEDLDRAINAFTRNGIKVLKSQQVYAL